MASDDNDEYTIDELASLTRVPSRTIRFYQSKGALPAPSIKGRVAYYGPPHIERLRLIAKLQDRGLRIKAIRDLVGKMDKDELDLNEWLGLDEKVQAPWADDSPRLLSEAEIYEIAGERRPGILGEMLKQRLIQRQGDAYLVRSPGLLRIACRLEAAGIDLEMAAAGAGIIRKHLARAAGELAEYYFKHAGKGFGRRPTVSDLSTAFEAVRPMGLEAVRLIFGQEMERVLRKLVESGRTTTLPARKSKSGNR